MKRAADSGEQHSETQITDTVFTNHGMKQMSLEAAFGISNLHITDDSM